MQLRLRKLSLALALVIVLAACQSTPATPAAPAGTDGTPVPLGLAIAPTLPNPTAAYHLNGLPGHPVKLALQVSSVGSSGSKPTVELDNVSVADFAVSGLPLTLDQDAAPKAINVECTPKAGTPVEGTIHFKLNGVRLERAVRVVCSAAGEAVGLYRPKTAQFFLRYTNVGAGGVNLDFAYGQPGDLPVVGDWNGDGVDTIGVFRPTTREFILSDENKTPTAPAYSFIFGETGDLPIAGDWDGDGKDSVGLYRPSTAQFFLRNDLSIGGADFIMLFGQKGDQPTAGDWDGDGKDTPAVYRAGQGVFYVKANCNDCAAELGGSLLDPTQGVLPVVGDWSGDGKTDMGRYNPARAQFELTIVPEPRQFMELVLGEGTDIPLSGKWVK